MRKRDKPYPPRPEVTMPVSAARTSVLWFAVIGAILLAAGNRRLRPIAGARVTHRRAPRGRRLHPLRTAGARLGAVPDHLRGDGDAPGRPAVLQHHPEGQRGQRRGRVRPDDRAAAAVQGGHRRRGEGRRPGERRSGGELHPGHAGAAGARQGRDAPSHREDVHGREVVLPRGRSDRLQPRPRDPAQCRGAAEGVRTGRLQRAVADPERG